jgi:hypothetical protein
MLRGYFTAAMLALIAATATGYWMFPASYSNEYSKLNSLIPRSDSSAENVTTTNLTATQSNTSVVVFCPIGNWSSIYSKFESDVTPENGTANSGQQYLNNPEFVSFLGQYINMSDPANISLLGRLFSGNQSISLQEQLQAVCHG